MDHHSFLFNFPIFALSFGPWLCIDHRLQDVNDEVLGSLVDRGMQLVQPQLVLQHVFLLIIDLAEAESVT